MKDLALVPLIAALALTVLVAARPAAAQPEDPEAAAPERMSVQRLARVLARLDAGVRLGPRGFELSLGDVPVLVIVDPRADRMRAMVPVRSAEGMSAEELLRVMQANFDSALDARYAVAGGRLWAVFLHPLSPLDDRQLISGLGQAVNAATSYGTLYSSGAGQFGTGDSARLQREFLQGLLEKGEAL